MLALFLVQMLVFMLLLNLSTLKLNLIVGHGSVLYSFSNLILIHCQQITTNHMSDVRSSGYG
jgi:hypothetical protein